VGLQPADLRVAATRRAGAILDRAEPGRIAALLDDFNATAEPA